MVNEAVSAAAGRRPLLIVLNKRDLLKPGEIARKLDVGTFILTACCFGYGFFT